VRWYPRSPVTLDRLKSLLAEQAVKLNQQ